MKNIAHHPADDVLLRYVGGHYDPAYSLVLATHISLCQKCQRSIAIHQEIGGLALEDQKPAEMTLSAEDLLDAPAKPDIQTPSAQAGFSRTFGLNIPAVLNAYLGKGFDALKWQTLSPSLKQHIISIDGKAMARLLWMAPGKSVPAHGHTGEEMSLILSGGYYDGDEAYTQGDLHWANHKTPHIPIAMEEAPCLVLAATDSPLIFRNFIPRLLQPLFKI